MVNVTSTNSTSTADLQVIDESFPGADFFGFYCSLLNPNCPVSLDTLSLNTEPLSELLKISRTATPS